MKMASLSVKESIDQNNSFESDNYEETEEEEEDNVGSNSVDYFSTTPEKKEVHARLNYPEKCIKICYI